MAGALGRALLNAWGGARKTSLNAKGWHAQISYLTKTQEGRDAADRAGIDITKRTLMDWLTERREPSKANRTKIDEAYKSVANEWNADNETRVYRIHGVIKIGTDERTRTLVINGRSGQWAPIRDAWNAGGLDPAMAERLFITQVIFADLGEWSVPPEFPGDHYTV